MHLMFDFELKIVSVKKQQFLVDENCYKQWFTRFKIKTPVKISPILFILCVIFKIKKKHSAILLVYPFNKMVFYYFLMKTVLFSSHKQISKQLTVGFTFK